jgi:hypothetical protein
MSNIETDIFAAAMSPVSLPPALRRFRSDCLARVELVAGRINRAREEINRIQDPDEVTYYIRAMFAVLGGGRRAEADCEVALAKAVSAHNARYIAASVLCLARVALNQRRERSALDILALNTRL